MVQLHKSILALRVYTGLHIIISNNYRCNGINVKVNGAYVSSIQSVKLPTSTSPRLPYRLG